MSGGSQGGCAVDLDSALNEPVLEVFRLALRFALSEPEVLLDGLAHREGPERGQPAREAGLKVGSRLRLDRRYW